MFSRKKMIGKRLTAMALALIMALPMASMPAKSVEAASAAKAAGDVEAYEGKAQGIDIKLYNYTNKINYQLKKGSENKAPSELTADDYEKRPIAPYFNFRASNYSGVGDELDLVLEAMTANSSYDADGYTKEHATVERVLDDEGYPVLDLSRHTAAKVTLSDPSNPEKTDKELRSLKYLFSDGDHAVTEYIPNNTFLIKNPEKENLYFYDSKQNAVDYDTTTNMFHVRNYKERTASTASYGDYYDYLPFNYTEGKTIEGKTYNLETNDVDYWFGTTMEVDFFQTKDGMVGDVPMSFSFTGDDDVWVFIDNVLVLDLGGTHGAVEGVIDFSTGEIRQYLSFQGANSSHNGKDKTTTSFPTTLRACYEAAGEEPNGGWSDNGNTFADYTKHKLKFFYLERGGGVANCKLDYELNTLPENSLTVTKNLTTTGTNTEVKEFIEDSLTYKFRVLKAKNGTVSNTLFMKAGTEFDIMEGGQKVGTGEVGDDGYFTLKAGQSAQFLNVLELGNGAKNYVVEEVMPDGLTGQYGGVEYSVEAQDGTIKKEINKEVVENFAGYKTAVLSAEETQTVTYNNRVDTSKLGVLTVAKVKAAGATYEEDNEFDIQVSLGDKPLPKGTKYTVDYLDTKDVVEAIPGEVTKEGFITLKSGEAATLVQNILSGTKYKIVEDTPEGYNANYTGVIKTSDGEDNIAYGADKAEGEFPVGATVYVTVENANYDFSATVPVSKQAVGNNTKATFDFTVERVEKKEDGTYETVENESYPGCSITVEKDEAELGEIVIGYQKKTEGTFYYKIKEKTGGDAFIYDNTFYIVKVVTNGNSAGKPIIWKNVTNINDVENEEVSTKVTGAKFVNQKVGSLRVEKLVEGKNEAGKFKFDYTIINGDEVIDGDEFFLEHDESKLLTKIPVGATVIVEEEYASGYVAHNKIGKDGKYSEGNVATATITPETTAVIFKNVEYSKMVEDTVVIDYGKSIEIDVLENEPKLKTEKNEPVKYEYGYDKSVVGFVTTDTANLDAFTELADGAVFTNTATNGKYQIEDGKVVFTPGEILSGVEKVDVVVKVSKGDHTFYQRNLLNIVPANIMYYETDFAENVFTLTTTGEEWETRTSEGAEDVNRQDDGTVGQNLYGYDSSYDNDTLLSNGTSAFVKGAGVWDTLAKFWFTGTGFDLISRTGAEQGAIRVDIYSDEPTDADEEEAYFIKSISVLNKSESNLELYQIPVVSAEMEEHGTYYVTIGVNAEYKNDNYPEFNRGGEFYFDAIRVYNTIDEDHEDFALANTAYMADNEANMELKEVRDMLLSKDADILEDENGNSIVFVDRVYNTEDDGVILEDPDKEDDVVEIATYENIGPNNEVYLIGSQAIGFGINVEDEKGIPTSIDIGAKSANGQSAYLNIFVWADDEEKPVAVIEEELTSSTVQFYDILNNQNLAELFASYENLYVTIDNAGEGILSITDLKIAYGNGVMNANVFVNEKVAQYTLARAASFFAEEPVNYDVVNAEFTQTSMKRNKVATLMITTSESVETLKIANKAGKNQTFTVESVDCVDGVKTWKVEFKISSMGTQTFTISGFGANDETGTTATASINVTR